MSKKTKHNLPRKPEPNFIGFSEIQKKYLNEVRNRQVNEFNNAIESVYRELGIMEKIMKAPEGMYKLRMQDLSGLDVLPSPQKPDPPPPPPDPSKDTKPPSGKDN